MHFVKIVSVYTLNSHLLSLKVNITSQLNHFLVCWNIFEVSSTNGEDPAQQSDLGPNCLSIYFTGVKFVCRKMIQLLWNNTTPHFQLLPMSKVDQS